MRAGSKCNICAKIGFNEEKNVLPKLIEVIFDRTYLYPMFKVAQSNKS